MRGSAVGPEGGRSGATGLNFTSLTTCLFCFPIPFCLPFFPSLLPPLLCIFLSVCLYLAYPLPPTHRSSLHSPFPTSFPFPTPCPLHGEEQTPSLSSLTQVPSHSPPPSFPAPSSLLGRGGASLPLPPLLSLSEGGGPGEGGGVPLSACGSWRCVWWGWWGLSGGEGVLEAVPLVARAWASAASGRSASQS